MKARRGGFTLIELLVVIAIIAILAAIIFPVYARAKEAAYRGSDITGMNNLRTALQLYRTDQGAYPPELLGYVSPYMIGPVGANVIPASGITGALYPRRVDALSTFTPAYDKAGYTDTTTAVWPMQDPRALGSAPIVDTNGDGVIDGTDDIAGARQAYGPNDGYVSLVGSQLGADPNPSNALNYYQVDGYEVSRVPTATNTYQWQLHYALFWTVDGIAGGSVNDDPRQLGYDDPPDTTPILWDTYFCDYNGGVPTHGKSDIVLFLGGGARPYDSNDLAMRSWRVMP